eukprot:SM000139S00133  [mRNA]  locus=s139:314853:320822:+ [translate_table: standard]
MLCQAAASMGVAVDVLDPSPHAPAGRLARRHVRGSFRDTAAVRDFARGCGVLTVEIEHVDVGTLEQLEEEGVDVEPKPCSIRVIQDKYAQKVHFSEHAVPLPQYMEVDSVKTMAAAGQAFGYPFMLKSRREAYDGRGNAVVHSESQASHCFTLLGGGRDGLYAEKMVPFTKELAVMVARGRDGKLMTYPVVETTHRDNICHTVEAPAAISREASQEALRVAERAVASLEGAGVFGVELFLLDNGQVLLNEVAPRPHNSGHYTIEACVTSQYEQHLRAILGLPLGDASMKVPAAVMLNVLGEAEGDKGFAKVHELLMRAMAIPGATVHWYEKPEIRPQRKMGHITIVGADAATTKQKLHSISGQHDLDTSSKPAQKASGIAKVGIIMGSDSDLSVMSQAAQILEESGLTFEVTVVSAHRTPNRVFEYAKEAHERGVRVIIAGAGGAAHLPGMVAAMTPLPVIGVPVRASTLDGLDSLLSIVQMPRGVPVATVAINNAINAGLLAVRIIASGDDPTLLEAVVAYQRRMESTVLSKAEKLEQQGWRSYLQSMDS